MHVSECVNFSFSIWLGDDDADDDDDDDAAADDNSDVQRSVMAKSLSRAEIEFYKPMEKRKWKWCGE